MVAQVVNAAASSGAPAVMSLYVAGLDAHVTDSQLYDLFSRTGDVVSVRVFRDLSSGLSLGYGYVNYANPQCAQRALEELNFTSLNRKPIKIMSSNKEPSMSRSGAGNIYIKNLSREIDRKALHETFSSFGNILSCKVAKDASGQSMGYGFVQFAGEESAQKAIRELNGMLLNGKQVYVGTYLSKEERKLFVDKANFTNVFVKNFSESTTEDDLKNIFGEFGLITSTVVMRDEDGTSKCFGFVNFAKAGDAARAVESLNGQIFYNKKWYVGRAQKKFERQVDLKRHLECVKEAFDKGSNLYVKNLDNSIGDEKLKEFFSPFGLVTSWQVMRDKKGISTGRGLVAFSSPEEASRALSVMNGKVLVGKPLHVALALRKEDRRSGFQNMGKDIYHKALPETFSSFENIVSCKVATDASVQSMSSGFVQFAGVESFQKAIGEFNGIVGKLNGIIVELNGIIGELNGMLLNGKQVYGGPSLSKQEMVMSSEDGTSKCFGVVNSDNAEDAARAVESLNGEKFDKLAELKKSFKQCVKEAVDKGCNLYVKNLDDSIGTEKLKELFSPFGTVISCKVMRYQKGISIGSGFVAFSSPEEASRAIAEMNGKILVSKPLYVALAQRKEDRRAQLQNLDKEIDHKALPESFSSSGHLLSCKIATDASGQPVGCGFLQFSGEEYAQKATGEHNGMALNEKQVCLGSFLSKHETELSMDNANFNNVFVKNFCESTTEDDLKNIFGEFGSITNTVVMRNEDGTSKCFGFVSFENAEDAAKAVESLNGQKFHKKRCYVGRAQKEVERELELKHDSEKCVKEAVDKGPNLSVNNLDDSIGDRKLSELFSPFGSVTSCKVMQDGKQIGRGRGLVASSLPQEASRALSEMNGKILASKSLYVALAQRKEDRRAWLQFAPMKPITLVPSITFFMPVYTSGGPGLGKQIFYGQPPTIITPYQPGLGYQELLVPGMRPAGPLLLNMFVPLVQQQQRGSLLGGRRTNAGPMQNGPQPAPAMPQQTLPRGRGYCHPPAGMFSVQNEMSGLPLHDAGMPQPIPVGSLVSSLANASPLSRGRFLVKFCTRLLNN